MAERAPTDESPGQAPEVAPRERRDASRRRERSTARGRWLLRAVAVAAVFLIGLVIGMAIEDRPRPGGEQTIVNTLRVSTLAPSETVTVTVQSP
jgi:hypothetical protein